MEKIGFDLDGCVIDFTEQFINYMYQNFNYKMRKEDILSHEMVEFTLSKFNGTKEDINKCIEVIINNNNFKPYYESIPILCNVAKFYGKVIFITARPKELEESTKKWLNKLLFPIPYEIYFSKDKVKICKELNISRMVEDHPINALNLAKNDIKVYLIKRPWNKNYEKHENIFHITWEDFDVLF